MKKKLNPIEEYATQIVREIGRWNYILENGCNDPFESYTKSYNFLQA